MASSCSRPQRCESSPTRPRPSASYHCSRGWSGRAHSWHRKKSMRMAHSLCFHVMRPMRAPPFSTRSAPAMPSRISSNSRFTWMRRAWKASFAGCMAWYSLPPLARCTRSAKSRVRFERPLPSAPRASATASAMRRAAAASSPPSSLKTSAISSREAFRSQRQTGTPREVSKRMSSSASCSGRKPRSPSSCGELMPRSKSTPATAPSSVVPACSSGAAFCGSASSSSLLKVAPPRPMSSPTLAIELKDAWCILKRLSSASSALPVDTASGSMSKALRRPRRASFASMARVWPPRPKVPST
mmetsp:Transcript_73533/g.228681  ORF Transcript_73533/g.228681 Transcript_73533/m.228681 type:complete len:300 (-) Transcript_73533:279-1178(-)